MQVEILIGSGKRIGSVRYLDIHGEHPDYGSYFTVVAVTLLSDEHNEHFVLFDLAADAYGEKVVVNKDGSTFTDSGPIATLKDENGNLTWLFQIRAETVDFSNPNEVKYLLEESANYFSEGLEAEPPF